MLAFRADPERWRSAEMSASRANRCLRDRVAGLFHGHGRRRGRFRTCRGAQRSVGPWVASARSMERLAGAVCAVATARLDDQRVTTHRLNPKPARVGEPARASIRWPRASADNHRLVWLRRSVRPADPESLPVGDQQRELGVGSDQQPGLREQTGRRRDIVRTRGLERSRVRACGQAHHV